jgi:threonine aldolase
MDGARISNAAAALNCSLAQTTCQVGVDVLSFGGTKNGLMFGEAVIFFNRELSAQTPFIRKQSAQLHSKMRFVAAQFSAFLTNELWRKNALHANKMAGVLAKEASKISNITITQKVEANGVFAIIPQAWITQLQQEFFFYIWDESKSVVRWMTSFDTTQEDIDSFVSLLKQVSGNLKN